MACFGFLAFVPANCADFCVRMSCSDKKKSKPDFYVLIRGNESYMLQFAEQSKYKVLLTGKKIREPFMKMHRASYMPFNHAEMSSLVLNRIKTVSVMWSQHIYGATMSTFV